MNTQSPQTGENSSGHKETPATSPRRILVVDDDTGVRAALREVLASEGYVAVPAGGGLQAVALAASTPPDLVLLDINLIGQSGWDVFADLASAHPDVPIIVITARPGQQGQATRLRADALMEKPLNLQLLLDTIGKLLAEPTGQRARRRNDVAFKTPCLSVMARRPGHGKARPSNTTPSDVRQKGGEAGAKKRGEPDAKRILVVDDDASVRLMLGQLLSEEGYGVGEAANGEEALVVAAKEHFDLMLLDLNMPVKNGWDTFERLTSVNPYLPVVIITARPNQVFTALGAGVGGLLEKPLDFPKLLQTIRVLLAEPPEVHLARMAGRRAEFYYEPAGERGRSDEENRAHRKVAGR